MARAWFNFKPPGTAAALSNYDLNAMAQQFPASSGGTVAVTLTSALSSSSAQDGYANSDTATLFNGVAAAYGALSPTAIGPYTLTGLYWNGGSVGVRGINLVFENTDATGNTPPSSFITSVAFTGDAGTFSGTLLGSAISPGNMGPFSGKFFKQWHWGLGGGFTPTTDPFALHACYVITIVHT